MTIAITNPLASLAPLSVGQHCLFTATATAPDSPYNLIWTATLNGGAPQMFGNGPRAVMACPAAVSNADGAGNKGADVIVATATDPSTMNSASITCLLVQGVPRINCTYPVGAVTAGVPLPGSEPKDHHRDGGPADTTTPGSATVIDQANEPGEPWIAEPCINLQPAAYPAGGSRVVSGSEQEGCGCAAPLGVYTPAGDTTSGGGPDGNNLSVATPGGGRRGGVVLSAAAFCPPEMVYTGSQGWSRGYGALQVRSGCGSLATRGVPLELCTWFLNVADALASAERIAGNRCSFGWQVRLIQDSTGNVAIYWGDRSVEAWKTTDGGSTFVSPRGTFGSLTKQGDGSFTRTTKDVTYYDFDSAGRLQKIKDRTQDGNVVYFNYNGSNQLIRIAGSGLGYRPYFSYDGNGRVSAMNLEGAAGWPERTTYFDYDASGRLNKAIWPENCITYFDYDGNGNRSVEINPDNYRTYFGYGSESVPRVREINLPADAAVYFTYDNTVPRQTVAQADGPSRTSDYQWAGLALAAAMGSEIAYFDYDGEAKPTVALATDGNLTYWEWDGSGQMTAQRGCEDTLQYFTYGAAGRITSWKDPSGHAWYWNYDASGLQTNAIDPLGNCAYFERDACGRVSSKKDRRGNVTYFTWNTQGLVTSVLRADGTVRYFDYNPAGEVETVVDELGDAAYFHHDRRGRITRWEDFAGQATDYGYDNRSNLTVMVDRRGNAWYWEYDGLSRRIAARTALLNTSYFNYSRENALRSQVDPRGNPTYFYYTSEKRLLARESALRELTYFTYTPAGQVESEKDPRGFARYFTYDCRHRLASSKDGAGSVTSIVYDEDGNRAAVLDPRGYATYFYHDALNRLTAQRNALGEVAYFYYDAEGNRIASEDPLQRRTYFYFDALDRRYAAEDAQRNLAYFAFEARGLVAAATDPRGAVTYFYHDALGRQYCVRDARGGLAYLEYDANSNRIASRDPRGNSSSFAFDADNRNVAATTPLGQSTYFTYDAAGNRTAALDARGNASYFYFDALNRSFCAEDARQARTYFAFDAAGNTAAEKDPLSRVTYHEYDGANRRFATRDAAGNFRYFTFDAAGNNDSVKGPRGFVTYLDYDALNRTFRRRSPAGGLTYFAFDAAGNRRSVQDPLNRFTYFYYDSLNRQQAVEDGLQYRTYFEYDAAGNTVSIRNARRAAVTPAEVGIQYFTYDAVNRRNSATDEAGKTWYYDYDAASNLQVQRNPRAAHTYWEYDALNRKQSQRDPLGRGWYWTYDAVGNVNSVKDGKAQTTYYQYGATSLLERTDYPDGTKAYFEYDAARQRTAMADPIGRTVWQYDALGRATYRLNPWAGAPVATLVQRLYYQYDGAGNRTSLKDQDGKLVYYDWDEADRMKEVRSPDYGGWLAYYEYSAADQMVHERRQNGTVTYHGYDAAGRVSRIQHRKSGGSDLDTLYFTRDEAGNPIRIDFHPYNTAPGGYYYQYFNYDPANRITRELWKTTGGSDIYGFDYAYDEAGNRKHKQHFAPGSGTQYWDYDLGDQLTVQREGGTAKVYFEFDPNGNLAVEHDVHASAGRTYYDYEPRNLLKRVDFPGATATNYFYYNGLGERVRKDDATAPKVYTWDGIDVIVEKKASNGGGLNRLIKGYAPVGGIGAYLFVDPGAAGTRKYFFHRNQVGSTLLLTDASQRVVNVYRSDAWGQPFEATETAPVQYRFNGKELDPDFVAYNSNNRRYHYPHRSYVPFRAQLLQFDPLLRSLTLIRVRRHLKVLAYQLGDGLPTLDLDPTGLESIGVLRCFEAAKEVYEDYFHQRMIDRMIKAGCKPPEVICQCCIGNELGSTERIWGGGNSRITLCSDNILDPHEAKQTLRHELVHAYDFCGHEGEDDCAHLACTEIRAAALSGQCDTISPLHHKQCVSAEAASNLAHNAKCANPALWVQRAWKDCYVVQGGDWGAMPHKIRWSYWD